LNAEADAIDANIKTQEESEEYKALAGQVKYEADKVSHKDIIKSLDSTKEYDRSS
jgi:hypothetical protein